MESAGLKKEVAFLNVHTTGKKGEVSSLTYIIEIPIALPMVHSNTVAPRFKGLGGK